jgi:hypothetical protein
VEDFSKNGTMCLFDAAVVFATNEVRSYLFMLSSADPTKKIDTNAEIVMGTLQLDWKNYMGDPGTLKVGPYKTVTKLPQDVSAIEIEAVES